MLLMVYYDLSQQNIIAYILLLIQSGFNVIGLSSSLRMLTKIKDEVNPLKEV